MKKLLIIIFGVMLAGCVSKTVRNQQQDEINRTIPACSSQKQCDAAWSAARQWVTQNCGMKIQNYSNDYMETYNSIGDSTAIACQVTKNPHPNGVNTIDARMSCANMFGCTPDQFQSVIAFNKYINNAIGMVSPIKMGASLEMSNSKGDAVENPSYSAGLRVKSLAPGWAASKAGLKAGDIITDVDGERVRTQYDMTTLMEKHHSGDVVELKVLRSGVSSNLHINL